MQIRKHKQFFFHVFSHIFILQSSRLNLLPPSRRARSCVHSFKNAFFASPFFQLWHLQISEGFSEFCMLFLLVFMQSFFSFNLMAVALRQVCLSGFIHKNLVDTILSFFSLLYYVPSFFPRKLSSCNINEKLLQRAMEEDAHSAQIWLMR